MLICIGGGIRDSLFELWQESIIHLIKIDNRTIKPTDFQQLCQRSVG